jgi:predicted RNase H-like HicB family nuclease
MEWLSSGSFRRNPGYASRPEGAAMMRYAVVIEKTEGNYSAYVPDLPGCVATGETVKAVEAEIREAIRFHIEGLKADGPRCPRRPASRTTSRPSLQLD